MKFPSDNVKPKREALEELIGAQALSADLKTAIVAALTGRESRRWTVGELFDRLNNLGGFVAQNRRWREPWESWSLSLPSARFSPGRRSQDIGNTYGSGHR